MLILDGYNILHQYSAQADDKARSQFIKQCVAYARIKKLSIMIVFDGGPFIWPYRETASKYVTIAYAGMRESADDYIKEYVAKNRGKQLIVVSDDNALRDAVRAERAEPLRVQDFLSFIRDARHSVQHKKVVGPTEKLTESSHEGVDALMFEAAASIIQGKGEEDQQKGRTSSSQQLSKQERRKYKKLKKL